MKEKLLEVKNLTIQYKEAPAPVVENLSFSLEEGEIVCLAGRSGKGKSTVVWAIMGMLEEYGAKATGSICFQGEERHYTETSYMKSFGWKQIALVPQASMGAFHPIYTIEKSLDEMLRAYEPGIPKKERMERIRQLAAMARLDEKMLKSYPHELSGGMKQRAAIAMAIMFRPRLLILDEATTGLDLVIQAEVLATILKLQKETGMSILFISHDKNLASHFAGRCIDL